MDGQPVIANAKQIHLRPWDHCIPFDSLSEDNLPPFRVRLRDDQVGHLQRWNSETHCLGARELGSYWPKVFTKDGSLWTGRGNWGPAYAGDKRLDGGPNLPPYEDLGFPPTWTSSSKIMKPEASFTHGNAPKKRKVYENAEDGD